VDILIESFDLKFIFRQEIWIFDKDDAYLFDRVIVNIVWKNSDFMLRDNLY